MKNVKVIKIMSDSIEFDNGIILSSDHAQDCSEHHYLCFEDLTGDDFEGLEFDLTTDNFFERIEDYGIQLNPISGHSVRLPGYGSNNGYYSSHLDLVLMDGNKVVKTFDISECQVIRD